MNRALVLENGGASYLTDRTVRSLRQLGIDSAIVRNEAAIAEITSATVALQSTQESGLWVLRAGSWVTAKDMACPRASATGRPVVAVGVARQPEGSRIEGLESEVLYWQKRLKELGGDFQNLFTSEGSPLPSGLPVSVWFDPSLAKILVDRWGALGKLEEALGEVMRFPSNRTIHWKPFDVFVDDRLRIVQVITSLQRGGAERIALSLHHCWLQDSRMAPLLIALAPAARDSYDLTDGCVVMPGVGSRQERVSTCVESLNRFGCDVVHSHLLTYEEMSQLGACGIPHIVTVHNAKPGWPAGFESVGKTQADLIVACSKAVEENLRTAHLRVSVRTIWNGIESVGARLTPEQRMKARNEVRRQHGISADSIVLISIANIRPQKRLDRIPRIMSALKRRLQEFGDLRTVRLLLVGERSSSGADAMSAEDSLRKAIIEERLEDAVIWVGSVSQPELWLCAADVMINVSDYEGLSLAQLEAISAGVPVVTYPAGGTAEIGREDAGLFLVPSGADSELFASTILRSVSAEWLSPQTGDQRVNASRLTYGFTLKCMSERYRQFYQVINRRKRSGLLLVINNLSVGGAQSSAARLLLELHRRGVTVRAAVLQEEPGNPTQGHKRLINAGIPVRVLPKAGTIDPQVAVMQLLTTDVMPEVIFLWNALPGYKVLIADLAIESRIFDISPGEMNFDSLERYFQQPVQGVPLQSPADYGSRLAGSVVKYSSERQRAEEFFGAPVHVIPNGVPVPNEYVRHADKPVIVFGTSARINPQKRIEELLAAFRRLFELSGNCELQIAGGVEPGCEQYADRLRDTVEGLPVKWLGNVDDVTPFLLSIDVFVMISHPAGCPNASLEAMAVGLPVVATDYGGVSEQVDECNGELVPDGEPEQLARAMLRLLSDVELRARKGAASRKRVESQFSLTRMVERYVRCGSLVRDEGMRG